MKLSDALSSLKRLQDVVRVARDVHNTQRTVAMLPTDTEASINRVAQSGEQIEPIVRGIQSMLIAFTVPSRSRGSSGYSTEEEDDDEVPSSQRTMNQERSRQQYTDGATSGAPIWGAVAADPAFFSVHGHERMSEPSTPRVYSGAPRTNSSHDTTPKRFPTSTEIIGQKRRAISPLVPSDHSFLRPTAIGELHREVERRSIWPRHHQYRLLHSRPRSPVQQSEKKVAQVIDGLERRLSKLPEEEQDGVFSTSIKSVLKVTRLTHVKGEEANIQEAVDNATAAATALLHGDTTFPESDDRLEDLRQVLMTMCSTQLRKFLLLKYKRPAEISRVDQTKLASVVAEAQGWDSVNDCSASRFGEIMILVTEVLEGSYEEWEPREDALLAELIGIMIIRLGAFKDSHVQQKRLYEVNGWLYKMSGTSFTPTLDLKSETPPQTAGVYVTANKGFYSMDDVEDGFNRISKAKATKSFGFLTMTLYTFLATASLTRDQTLLPTNQLIRFNKDVQELKEFNVEGEQWAVLQSYQDLEKILYLMRVLMHQRPEYVESSVRYVFTVRLLLL
ncbi:Hypothetical protein PHPALM_943 [Phytophthora palmivora]|uniref:Uncharacterized protein n=1 Tax=Phytophthora palmivora TaxID=4796 RepID=A0A2P4YTL9_9STRA|nr:Hypothetical protein PHPALM_943 [Phytophthora palmivora]